MNKLTDDNISSFHTHSNLLNKNSENADLKTYMKNIPLELRQIPLPVLASNSITKLQTQYSYFSCPDWVDRVPNGFYLKASKLNSDPQTIPLIDHSYFLMGRNSLVVDIHLEHPSISGIHCALCYNKLKLCFFIVDLSTNGTFLHTKDSNNNIKRLIKGEFTEIRIGSKFHVGQSARVYTLKRDIYTSTSRSKNIRSETNDKCNEGVDQLLIHPKNKYKVFLSHILIKHKDVANPVNKNPKNKNKPITRTEQEAIDRATMIYNSLCQSSNHSFEQLVEEFSECSTAKSKKGKLGWIEQGTFASEFESVAFQLIPGELSKPTISSLGVHIIRRHLKHEIPEE